MYLSDSERESTSNFRKPYTDNWWNTYPRNISSTSFSNITQKNQDIWNHFVIRELLWAYGLGELLNIYPDHSTR
jgi:hypothetical protein